MTPPLPSPATRRNGRHFLWEQTFNCLPCRHVREAMRYIVSSLRLTSPGWPPQSTIQLNGHIVDHTFILTFVSCEEIFMCPLEQSVWITFCARLTDLVDIWSGLTRGSSAGRHLRPQLMGKHPTSRSSCKLLLLRLFCSFIFCGGTRGKSWRTESQRPLTFPSSCKLGPFAIDKGPQSCVEAEGRHCCLFSCCLYFSKH